MREPRLRRSLLITPGNRADRLAKALTLGADAVVFDLEDGVPPGEKAAARRCIAEMLGTADFAGRERCVRLNAIGTPEIAADLAALPLRMVDTVMVPKVERPADLAGLEAELREREAGAGAKPVELIVSIETPRGVLGALAIADASPRASALFFGSGDYAAVTGSAVTAGALHWPRATIVAAATAAGLQAIDAAFFGAVKDSEATRQDALLARELGFSGKLVFHPAQVTAVNEVFSPTCEEIAWAEKVVRSHRDAQDRGAGTALVDGTFVAIDVVLMAERILNSAHAIGSRRDDWRG